MRLSLATLYKVSLRGFFRWVPACAGMTDEVPYRFVRDFRLIMFPIICFRRHNPIWQPGLMYMQPLDAVGRVRVCNKHG